MKYLKYSLLLFLTFSFFASAQKSYNSPTEFKVNKTKSIFGSTAASNTHQTLLTVIQATDLENLLDEAGPFTVFAPSDVAFENIAGKSLNYFLDPSNKEELKKLITYHIVAGKLSASRILKAMCRGGGRASFTTVQGDEIVATMKGLDIILRDSHGNTATIVVADSNQSNGVIHEIDNVILPHTKI